MLSIAVNLRALARYITVCKLSYYISYLLLVVLFANLLVGSCATAVATRKAVIDMLNNSCA